MAGSITCSPDQARFRDRRPGTVAEAAGRDGRSDPAPRRDPGVRGARWRLEPLDAEARGASLAKLPDRVKQLRERLEKGRSPPPAEKETERQEGRTGALKPSPSLAAACTSRAVESLRRSLKTWFTFYDGFTPEFSWWVRKPHEAADKATRGVRQVPPRGDRRPARQGRGSAGGRSRGRGGAEAAAGRRDDRLRAEEMIRIGERELARCEAEMRRAAKEMGLCENWKAALAEGQVARSCPPAARTTWSPSRPAKRSGSSRIDDLITDPAALRGDLAADDDLARAAEDHAIRGLWRPADDRRLCQRVDEARRQADGDARATTATSPASSRPMS